MPAISAACATAGRTSLLKLARSRLTARRALAGRKPVAITGETARERVHLLRAHSDAIMIGIGTALADDPMLTCRLPGMAELFAGAGRARQHAAAAAEFAFGVQRARGRARGS